MRPISNFIQIGIAVPLALAVCSLVSPTVLHGQGTPSYVEPPTNPTYDVDISEVDYCNLWEADFANSVEEDVCAQTDAYDDTQISISGEVDQDLTWYEGYPDWPSIGEDPNVAGLGVESIAYDNSTSTEVQDTGMYEGSIDGGNPPPADGPYYYAYSYSFAPNVGDTYQFEGYYSECIDPTGTGSSSCSWNGSNDSGIAVYLNIVGT